MFEFVLSRVHYDCKKKIWIQDDDVGVFDSLDKAFNAQAYDRIEKHDKYQYYIEYRIKLDYDSRRN